MKNKEELKTTTTTGKNLSFAAVTMAVALRNSPRHLEDRGCCSITFAAAVVVADDSASWTLNDQRL